jgi:hypothetical protein
MSKPKKAKIVAPPLIFLSKPAWRLQPRGLGYGALRCAALKSTYFELSEREKAAKRPLRRIKQAVFAYTSKYSGAKLREIRAQRGVGGPPLLMSLPTDHPVFQFARAA